MNTNFRTSLKFIKILRHNDYSTIIGYISKSYFKPILHICLGISSLQQKYVKIQIQTPKLKILLQKVKSNHIQPYICVCFGRLYRWIAQWFNLIILIYFSLRHKIQTDAYQLVYRIKIFVIKLIVPFTFNVILLKKDNYDA